MKLVCSYWKLTVDTALPREALPALVRTMDAVPRRRGLVWIDPGGPRSPYGFTDTVARTGFELFSSLLYWEAPRNLTEMCGQFGNHTCRENFQRRAAEIERGVDLWWSSEEKGLLAATLDCRQAGV